MNTLILIGKIMERADALSRKTMPGEPVPSSLKRGGLGIADLFALLDPPDPLVKLEAITDDVAFMLGYEWLLTNIGDMLMVEQAKRAVRS